MMANPQHDTFAKERRHMLQIQLRQRGIRDSRVLRAMEQTPRHHFVSPHQTQQAYGDHALPIEHNQTISQPFIVAKMAELAQIPPHNAKVLEIGAGSGYAAAVLSKLADKVHTLEVIPELAHSCQKRLQALGFERVTVHHGDGADGLPEEAPFDAILVAAAAPCLPTALLHQLKQGGHLVIPVDHNAQTQELRVFTKTQEGFHQQTIFPVRFVPMTGKIRSNQPS